MTYISNAGAACTGAIECSPPKTGGNDITCKDSTGFVNLCLSTNSTIFACKDNATAAGADSQCECDVGHYQNGTGAAATCTPCPEGSYQDETGKTTCKPCAGGTTGGTGRTTGCPANSCANGTNVATWVPTTWNNGVVEHLCEISNCEEGYNLSNNRCCPDGYQEDDGECIPKTYTITYLPGNPPNDGPGGEPQTQEVVFGTSFTTKPANTFAWEGSTFVRWGGLYPEADATYTYTIPNNTVLTAQWSPCPNTGAGNAQDWINCIIKKCKPGYYLSGTGMGTSCTACPAGKYCDGTTSQINCIKGYYCPGRVHISSCSSDTDIAQGADGINPYVPAQSCACDGRCKCPGGSTTSGVGVKEISECYMVGGTTGSRTRFCQDDGAACFYLPTDVSY